MPLDKAKAPFTLPKLPYAEDALAPVISAKTISFHYGKHHATYVKTLNELIGGTPVRGPVAGRDRRALGQGHGSFRQEDVQQRRPGVEPRFLLAQHVVEGRRAGRQDQGRAEGQLRRSRGIQEGLQAKPPSASSAAAGPGWSRPRTASSRSRRRRTPTRRSPTAAHRSSSPTCGSTPTTSTTRTAGPTTSPPGSTSSRTGRLPRRTSTRRNTMLGTILLIILILILIGALPQLGLQPRLGLLPQRRRRPRAAHRGDPAPDGTALGQ